MLKWFCSKMGSMRRIVLLWGLICASTLSGQEHVLTGPQYKVYFSNVDTTAARQCQTLLDTVFPEMLYDFQVEWSGDVRILIAPDRDAFVRISKGQLPDWTHAFAVPRDRLIVLKSPRWDRSRDPFKTTLVHELMHLLLFEAVGNRSLPRWLDEGLALFYSRDSRWETFTALSKAVMTGSLIPLQQIDDVLSYRRSKAELAYQQSYSAVKYLLTTYDIEALRILLKGIRKGQSWDQSFVLATGSTVAQFEREWQQYAEKTHKWLWLSELEIYIWIFILILAFLAVPLVRLRNRRRVAEWDTWSEVE